MAAGLGLFRYVYLEYLAELNGVRLLAIGYLRSYLWSQ